jgi:membrane protein DedA with SNARE-associated domain
MEHLIEQYGYWGIFLGTFLEGETILILGGFAAHRGYLALPGVMMCAFAGTLLSDQLLFFLGRRHGQAVLVRRPVWQERVARLKGWIGRNRILIILAFRFWYGLRIVTPFALGMSRVRWLEFILLNIVGALMWAAAVGGAGYLFGQVMEAVLGDIKRIEEILIMLAIVMIGLAFFVRHYRHGRDTGDPRR